MCIVASEKYRKSPKGLLYRTLNREKINKQVLEWKAKNPERKRELDRKYYLSRKNDPIFLARRRHNEAMRRARKLMATPKWLTIEQKEEIKLLYINCPNGYHVDHIVPLKGNIVSGLHVPWNLQHLPGTVNKQKSNKVSYGNTNSII